ncbi:hypothetical protein COW36_09240 [bacterium (Candidatus Blackallbacteria) CG17_big_fil_post_rev_8_21_14_2_50_48_46]|uniref:Histidine kinase n=1 Tax=bacterium (Candidatus Blackallbacteria) CG17_big_fil_post_rev_8_21_14_2_50_48_46 TaxID=2014261 RepID=A0A2M7G5P8_9BACT|nr:MAG: hypothetical protein COW64_23810 [bacterium (Candidatus Blackallbacteria) CG18_big_fil_WC_8_21_14_2_50_49_26]PIW17350.1 MAG: hypothetical protein COW36_09240 [bacterium (Candidatus Blackallbacteria) CG17_big_fil_post_rev_8_21_14_2_50_48_46]PIW47418.1 MAG: hypothetical protein COW20_12590 [bacterium (Candidatus Blackallbacteria) CG13_big_fil_rev_8_21_14_2_50_49_14]
MASLPEIQYLSASTQIPDPFRAGIQIGEKLLPIAPEVVFLFASCQYLENLSELAEGLYEILGENLILLGGTSDGFYETEAVAHHGVSAFAINAQGRVVWKLACVELREADWSKTAAQAAREALVPEQDPVLAFVFADGIYANGTQIAEGLRQVLSIPCLGGLVADDRRFKKTGLIANRQVIENSVLVLTASGDLPFWINAATGWMPTGDTSQVSSVQGNQLKQIGTQTAMKFIAEQTGRMVGAMDFGVVPLAVQAEVGQDIKVLRTSSDSNPETGSISLFGEVPLGAEINVCRSTLEEIIQAVDQALLPFDEARFKPAAVMAVSCAGRKWLFQEGGKEELNRIKTLLGPLPLVGFLSFGEIGPFYRHGEYSASYFHNMTFVVCVLGS